MLLRAGPQLGAFFSKMGARIGAALPSLHPEVASNLTNTFELAGWDLHSNRSVATAPPMIETVIMMLDNLIFAFQPYLTSLAAPDAPVTKGYNR